MAMKKSSSNGSDRGAKMKANYAEKKAKEKSEYLSGNKAGSPQAFLNSLSATQKKALGYVAKTDLAGLTSNLKGFIGQPKTRTSQRGVDQAKRAGVKAAKKANKK